MDIEDNKSVLLIHNKHPMFKLCDSLQEVIDLTRVDTYEEGIECFQELNHDCIILETNFSDKTNISNLDELIALGAQVITLTKSDNSEITQQALNHGAVENLTFAQIKSSGVTSIMRSVIERIELRNALQQSEDRFRDIAERVDEGLWIRCAYTRRCQYLNPAFVEIWGRSIDEMNKIEWKDTIHPDDQKMAYDCFVSHQNDHSDYRITYRVIRANGEQRWVENHGYSILDENGQLIRMAGIARDVTRQKSLEEDLRLAQKLESLGQLSAGIAHEINTPSQYVSDNISFLSDSIEDISSLLRAIPELISVAKGAGADPTVLTNFESICEEIDIDYLLEELPLSITESKNGMEQIKTIVLAMKGFSHQGDDKVLVNINDAIANTIIVAKNEWKYVATVETDYDPSLPKATCTASSINQVILNIIVNAAHAISSAFNEGELGVISISSSFDETNVIIKIGDNGTGMTEEIKVRIFDPFYTTKEVGRGTGQGLAIADKVIREEHSGSISVESTVGKGTTFIIKIPIEAVEVEESYWESV